MDRQQIDKLFERLDAVLKRTDVWADEAHTTRRKATASEFMLMKANGSAVDFKHSMSRNYVRLELGVGGDRLQIPVTNEPWCRGWFPADPFEVGRGEA